MRKELKEQQTSIIYVGGNNIDICSGLVRVKRVFGCSDWQTSTSTAVLRRVSMRCDANLR